MIDGLVSHYEFLERLGECSMGLVFKADDAEVDLALVRRESRPPTPLPEEDSR